VDVPRFGDRVPLSEWPEQHNDADAVAERYAGAALGFGNADTAQADAVRDDAGQTVVIDIDTYSDADTPEQDDSGYNRTSAAREDLHVLVAALDKVSDQLAQLTDTLQQQLDGGLDRPDLEQTAALEEQVDLATQIVPEVDQLKDVARELVKRGLDQAPDLAFSATAQMTVLRTDVRRARKRFSANSAWKRIWDLLKGLPQRLLSLISHLVKVKEWSVTGQVGTGMLGLAQASISVTFG
jgi:hypothetical protein